ncbi:MAG: translational GTPase TypA [Patescibacteria group bacterium]|jgi:GTP-binding protein|nr:translational GTPase TypA [Patescibacteria group bacterium]
MNIQDPAKIRNIAVIAHVDHGKTTIVDGFLKQSKTFRDNQAEMQQTLIMDSGDQERERGITITAKITAVQWNGYRINIIDTPGHADFSGEVERTLNMADGCLLIVDAQEGPMPQTKFVLSKALQLGLKPIVIINKIDKPGSRIFEVKDELDNLFLELAINENQLHYPIYYAVGREGKAWDEMPENPDSDSDLSVIFDAIISDIPAPNVEPDKPFQMLVTALAWDSFQGKYSIGRVSRGKALPGMQVALCQKDNQIIKSKIDKIYESQGLIKSEINNAISGDIVMLTGIGDAKIGETITDINTPEPLPVIDIEPPTLQIYLGPNTSPFKGKEGEFTTSRQIGDRLKKELETNVGLRVEQKDLGFKVSGRGELHLSVLIEAMRREGYEFEVGRPQVVTITQDNIVKEPIEHITVEVPPEYVGAVQMELGSRRAELLSQNTTSSGLMRINYKMPTRATLGMRNTLLTATKGTIIMNSLSSGYEPLSAELKQLRNGVLVAWENGVSTPYSLQTAQERGTCFIGPGTEVYAGQIVGLNSRGGDLEINVVKEKHLTNMRSKSSDGVVQLTPPVIMSLEQCIDFIENDELLEVTPKSLRLRKKELNHNLRKRKIN